VLALVAAGVALSLISSVLMLGTLARRGHLSRHEAIRLVANGNRFPRTAAKLMYASDLEDAEGRPLMSGRIDVKGHDRTWVVAVEGAAWSPSCAEGPSPCPSLTWSLAAVQDELGIVWPSLWTGGYSGHWPPYFDALPDLAAGPIGWFLS
jgi:hypothetical protein